MLAVREEGDRPGVRFSLRPAAQQLHERGGELGGSL